MSVHEQVAAFALDALGREEAEEFERHLPGCPACEDALAGLQSTAVSLAFALDLPAPRAQLRRRVLEVGAAVVPFHRRRRARLVAAAAAVAACAAVAAVIGPWNEGGGLGGLHRYTDQGARATLLVGGDGDAVLMVRRLPPPPPGKVYAIWVIAGGRTLPAGVIAGSTAALTRRVPHGATVAVSIEPARGSRQPTGPLLVRAETT